jgi:tRNA-Thr(GGU) m(6)t(6)A37 methyltransferase TsaA
MDRFCKDEFSNDRFVSSHMILTDHGLGLIMRVSKEATPTEGQDHSRGGFHMLNNSREEFKIEFTPIGIIHSPFTEPEGMPIQPAGASGVRGTVEVFEDFRAGLKDLEGFSHIILLYHFHRSQGFNLHVVPFMDTEPRGLFATRAPKRPNPIGLSVVQLDRIQDGVLYIQNVDILDGTPLLDIKPYVPEFDTQDEIQTGWLERAKWTVSQRTADGRFS